jgi:hypothetical protein
MLEGLREPVEIHLVLSRALRNLSSRGIRLKAWAALHEKYSSDMVAFCTTKYYSKRYWKSILLACWQDSMRRGCS